MKLAHWEPDLRTLFNWVENGEIDLQPNFQRGDVWPSYKKKRLIDTILREWSIPPIHVVVTPNGTLEVLDGQQRLTAIRDFMRDGFTVDGFIEPIDNKLSTLSGLRYSELPSQVRRSFDQYTLRVFKITDYGPEEPGELFYRLNQQITLTAGEQRNAIFGPAREQLKRLVSQFEDMDNRRETIGFSNARLAYDDVFAKLLFFVEHESFAEKATENRISDRFKLQRDFAPHHVERASQAIRHFTLARINASKLKLNKATLLSWLLFFCRFETFNPAPDYLWFFETAKLHISRYDDSKFDEYVNTDTLRPFDRDALALFVNRSSLRVSDVSSVVFRDFALWAVYERTKAGQIPASVDIDQVERIAHLLDERPDASLEFALDQELEIASWARI